MHQPRVFVQEAQRVRHLQQTVLDLQLCIALHSRSRRREGVRCTLDWHAGVTAFNAGAVQPQKPATPDSMPAHCSEQSCQASVQLARHAIQRFSHLTGAARGAQQQQPAAGCRQARPVGLPARQKWAQ